MRFSFWEETHSGLDHTKHDHLTTQRNIAKNLHRSRWGTLFIFVFLQVPIFSSTGCQANAGENYIEGTICAGGNKKGSCFVRNIFLFTIFYAQLFQGDSGGALAVEGVLAGIVSRGGSETCAKVFILYLILIISCFLGKCVWYLHWGSSLHALDQCNYNEHGRHASLWHQVGCSRTKRFDFIVVRMIANTSGFVFASKWYFILSQVLW